MLPSLLFDSESNINLVQHASKLFGQIARLVVKNFLIYLQKKLSIYPSIYLAQRRKTTLDRLLNRWSSKLSQLQSRIISFITCFIPLEIMVVICRECSRFGCRSRSRCRQQPIGSFEMAFESVAIDSGLKCSFTELASEGTNNMTRSRSGSSYPFSSSFIHFSFAIRSSILVSSFSFLASILGASLILQPTFSTSLFPDSISTVSPLIIAFIQQTCSFYSFDQHRWNRMKQNSQTWYPFSTFQKTQTNKQ